MPWYHMLVKEASRQSLLCPYTLRDSHLGAPMYVALISYDDTFFHACVTIDN